MSSVDRIRLFFVYTGRVFDPDADLPRANRSLVYVGACLIAGIRLARERQVMCLARSPHAGLNWVIAGAVAGPADVPRTRGAEPRATSTESPAVARSAHTRG